MRVPYNSSGGRFGTLTLRKVSRGSCRPGMPAAILAQVAAAPRQLTLGDDLRDQKCQQNGNAEAGEVESADAKIERMMDDRIGERHAATSPGMG